MLKTIVRLLEPDAGDVHVDGQDVAELRRDELYDLRRRVGYVFQFAALFDSMTVFDNVAMGLRRMRMPEPELGRAGAESLRSSRWTATRTACPPAVRRPAQARRTGARHRDAAEVRALR
jgi:ABC-type transporter Mla maintaining outer membrane lipid asymmetry ATPase subunit MlaF